MKRNYVIFGIAAILVIAIAVNYQQLFKAIVPARPVIVSTRADGSSSRLLDFSIKVTGVVRNEGGDGYVVIESELTQAGKQFKKTLQIFMVASQTEDFEITFDEARLLSSDPTYRVTAYALGH